MSTFLSRLRNQQRGVNRCATVASTLLLVIVWIIVLSIVGSPRLLLRMVGTTNVTLPSWVFLVMTFVFYAVCGFSIGAVLSCRHPVNETAKYRGAFFFSIALMLSYLWYALSFGARFFLPAVVLAFISSFCFLVSAVNFRVVFRLASVGMWIVFAWSLYLLFFSLFCFFFL